MADVHEPEVRSYNMSQIKGKDTKPEMVVRRFLHANGFRYRLHGKYKGKTLPGKPDIVLPKYNTVIFVHGCFWHGHEGCKYAKLPENNNKWWHEKILKNKNRDLLNEKKLEEKSWKIIVLWQCQLKQKAENKLDELVIKRIN